MFTIKLAQDIIFAFVSKRTVMSNFQIKQRDKSILINIIKEACGRIRTQIPTQFQPSHKDKIILPLN